MKPPAPKPVPKPAPKPAGPSQDQARRVTARVTAAVHAAYPHSTIRSITANRRDGWTVTLVLANGRHGSVQVTSRLSVGRFVPALGH
jgi:hypothetical protein